MPNSVRTKLIIWLAVCIIVVLGTGTVLAATTVGPELSIPNNIPAQANSIVDIPISYASNGKEITSMVFSVDYDETLLEFDPGLTNAIVFINIPGNYSKNCSFDPLNTDGELECNIIGFGDDIEVLTDGKLVTIKLRTKNASDGTIADVLFGSDPAPSFGNAEGQSEPGSAVNGSVYFGEINWFAFLPLLFKHTPAPTTETPTPVTPTPVTPTPETPTPTPETPTPPPSGCENLIVNGGFEEVDEAWYLPITNYPAKYTNAKSYLGEASMRTGINLAENTYSYSSAWQPVSIPDDAISAELSFYYNPQTTEPLALRLFSDMISQTNNPFEAGLGDPLIDQQMALILNEDQTHDQTLMSILSNSRTWTKSYTYDLLEYEGETIWVAFTTYNDGGGGKTAMYVDEVVLEVCK